MATKPAWYDKHPCVGTTSRGTSCGCGYLECAQFWTMGRKCCAECDHPTKREAGADAYTPEEIADMQRYHAERKAAT